MSNDYLQFDEREDFVCSLEHAAAIAHGRTANPGEWKWLILSVHSAWQGAMVAALSGTAGIGALDRKSQSRFLQWWESNRTNRGILPATERLADPMELFRRCLDANSMSEFGGAPLTVTPELADDLVKLNGLRVQFTHFKPTGWSIETAGLPRILLNAIDCTCVLISHPAIQLRITTTQRARLEATMSALRNALSV